MTTPITGSTQFTADASALLREAEALKVETNEDLAAAEELRNRAKRGLSAADAERTERKTPHLRAGQAIDDEYRSALGAFKRATEWAETAIRSYRRRLEEARRAEETRLREQQEKERLRLAKQAEKAEARGLDQTADALRQQADMMPPAYVPSRAKAPETMAVVKLWKFEITDAEAVPRDLCTPNETLIRQRVQAMRAAAINAIPGVRVYEEEGYRSK